MSTQRIGLAGARGYVAAELIPCIQAHPALELVCVGSRQLAGEKLRDHFDGVTSELRFSEFDASTIGDEDARLGVDIWILGLPNGHAHSYVAALDSAGSHAAILDLSADYRFDDAWSYGLPELYPLEKRRIANPGCYATAAQLALAPIRDLLSAPPRCFGISGYSGAGTTPSDKNNPDILRDNILPYAPIAHTHEREIGRHLGHPVHFLPHVASFFRGIMMTVDAELSDEVDKAELDARYREHYAHTPFVRYQEDVPSLHQVTDTALCTIGGLQTQGRRLALHSALDNLRKGAATQAMQNINRLLGLDESTGIRA